MEISTSQEQGRVPVTVFHISGDIDAATSEQLETRAQQAIQAGTRYLLLDLSKVNYVSSYGIRAITQVFNWLRDTASGEDSASVSKGLRDGKFKSSHLKLASPNKQVEKVLTTLGIDMYLEIHKNLKQAIDSF